MAPDTGQPWNVTRSCHPMKIVAPPVLGTTCIVGSALERNAQ
jgi:hypothetical protein